MSIPVCDTRQDLFDFLDDFARERKGEIDRWQLGKDTGLIKSYVIETSPLNGSSQTDTAEILRSTGWQIAATDDEELYRARDSKGQSLGYVEPLSERYLILHSIDKSQWIDRVVRRDVKKTSSLDSMWLAGGFFASLWQHLILPQSSERYVTLKFEHKARFEDLTEDNEELDEETSDDGLVYRIKERRASSLMIAERVSQIATFLPDLQKLHDPFKAIKMLRVPSRIGAGGYEFWMWGKITYRASSFRDGRSQVASVIRLYKQVTETIERMAWLQVEKIQLRDGHSLTFHGTPIILEFDPPLDLSAFHNFITTTFDRGQGPFRLWGNPIYLSEKKVHVYGIDLHLWQRIHLDLTPKRFVVILPKETCGNTIHRLITNTQRYLSPGVKAFVGNILYDDLIRDTFLGREIAYERNIV